MRVPQAGLSRRPFPSSDLRGLSWVSRVAAGVLVATLLAGCAVFGTGTSAPKQTFTPPPTEVNASPPGPDGVQQVTLVARESLFHPPNVRAHPGKIRVTVRNDDSLVHNFTLANGAGVSTGTIDGGKSASVQFTLTRTGRYHFFCTYHQDTGMVGSFDIQ